MCAIVNYAKFGNNSLKEGSHSISLSIFELEYVSSRDDEGEGDDS